VYNTLDSTLGFLKKEVKLLNSISDIFGEAMQSASSKGEFSLQFESIVVGVEESLRRQRGVLGEADRRLEGSRGQYMQLVEEQRSYYRCFLFLFFIFLFFLFFIIFYFLFCFLFFILFFCLLRTLKLSFVHLHQGGQGLAGGVRQERLAEPQARPDQATVGKGSRSRSRSRGVEADPDLRPASTPLLLLLLLLPYFRLCTVYYRTVYYVLCTVYYRPSSPESHLSVCI
jgi:hypothetical protein